MSRITAFALLVLFFSCQTNEKQSPPEEISLPEETSEISIDTNSAETTSLQHRIKGVWSNEASHDGIFEVTDTTFYYADNFVDYPYDLEGNRITIHYPDYTYEAEVSVVNDTLRMESEEQGVLVFWRFE